MVTDAFSIRVVQVNWDGAGRELCLSSVLGVLFLYQRTFPQGNRKSWTLEKKCFVNLPEVKVTICLFAFDYQLFHEFCDLVFRSP